MVAIPSSPSKNEIPEPITYQDWLLMPESNQIMELWNGEVIVPPGPESVHMDAQHELFVQLWSAAKGVPTAKVYSAPYDVRLRDQTVVQPDIVVFTGSSPGRQTRRGFEGVPELIVEVLSPSNRGYDLIRKAALYAEVGVPEYWVIDPAARHLILGRLADGYYEREIVHAGSVLCTALNAFISIDFLTGLTIDPEEHPL
jgi:Uma2 family endonuclease